MYGGMQKRWVGGGGGGGFDGEKYREVKNI